MAKISSWIFISSHFSAIYQYVSHLVHKIAILNHVEVSSVLQKKLEQFHCSVHSVVSCTAHNSSCSFSIGVCGCWEVIDSESSWVCQENLQLWIIAVNSLISHCLCPPMVGVPSMGDPNITWWGEVPVSCLQSRNGYWCMWGCVRWWLWLGGGGLKGTGFFHCQQNSDFKLRIKIPETSTVFNSKSIVCMLN